MSALLIFTKIATAFKAVMLILPSVLKAMIELEALWPQTGMGAEKRQMIKDALAATFAVVSDGKITFDELWPIIEKFIGIKVAQFNAQGWPGDAPAEPVVSPPTA